MPISNKSTVCSILKETKQGVLVTPTSAKTGLTQINEGFEISPEVSELESEELSGSLGRSRSVIGAENPTGSFTRYMRGSGTEGDAVDFDEVLEAALGGKQAAQAEIATIAGSTLKQLKTGATTLPVRGQALLIKDANGFSIRNVLSTGTGEINLAQASPRIAPDGTKLGRAVLYFPKPQYPTLSMLIYRGNGGSREFMSGAFVTELGLEITAGEFINGNFSLAGREYFFNPIVIPANAKLSIDGNDEDIKAGVYKDPIEFASYLQGVLRSAVNNKDLAVSYSSSTGKYTITGSANFSLELSASGSIGSLIGFGNADLTGEDSYEATNALTLKFPETLSYDDQAPLVAKGGEVLLGLADDTTCINASTLTATITNTKTDVQDVCSSTGRGDSRVSERVVELELSALLEPHQVREFERFRKGTELMFTANFGVKEGGNFKAGTCLNLFSPTMTITSFNITDSDGLAQLDLGLRAFSDNGAGEFYINTL